MGVVEPSLEIEEVIGAFLPLRAVDAQLSSSSSSQGVQGIARGPERIQQLEQGGRGDGRGLDRTATDQIDDAMEGTEQIIEDQTLARHILMTPNELMDDDIIKQKLTEIREDILAGDEFGAASDVELRFQQTPRFG